MVSQSSAIAYWPHSVRKVQHPTEVLISRMSFSKQMIRITAHTSTVQDLSGSLLADSLKSEIVRRVERDAMEAREEVGGVALNGWERPKVIAYLRCFIEVANRC